MVGAGAEAGYPFSWEHGLSEPVADAVYPGGFDMTTFPGFTALIEFPLGLVTYMANKLNSRIQDTNILIDSIFNYN